MAGADQSDKEASCPFCGATWCRENYPEDPKPEPQTETMREWMLRMNRELFD